MALAHLTLAGALVTMGSAASAASAAVAVAAICGRARPTHARTAGVHAQSLFSSRARARALPARTSPPPTPLAPFPSPRYGVAFSLSLGPVPNILSAELFPMRSRAAAMSVSLAAQFACNTAVGMLFPVARARLGSVRRHVSRWRQKSNHQITRARSPAPDLPCASRGRVRDTSGIHPGRNRP